MERLEENHEKYKYTIVKWITSLLMEARHLYYVGMAVKRSKLTTDNPWSGSRVMTKWAFMESSKKSLVLHWKIHVGSCLGFRNSISEIYFSGVPDLKGDVLWQKQHTEQSAHHRTQFCREGFISSILCFAKFSPCEKYVLNLTFYFTALAFSQGFDNWNSVCMRLTQWGLWKLAS